MRRLASHLPRLAGAGLSCRNRELGGDVAMMTSALVRKLLNFTPLSQGDRDALQKIGDERVRRFPAHTDVIQEGEATRNMFLVLSGWACRYKQLENGRRQIVAFFLPGDLCDLDVLILRKMDHSIGTLTPVTMAELSQAALDELLLGYPRVALGLRWESLVNIAIQREWTVNLGQRNAYERIAHLLCELVFRLRSIGLVHEDRCEFPLTQIELADVMGMSAVHVNRTLQELRGAGLIILRDRMLTVPRLPDLMAASMFNPAYLHLDREGHERGVSE
ncbi:Crp/Fnr family transcriptional regulator [Pseudoroseomonas globiformis]|uniref:Crp/Fnr family transcriptional regulator n=1 Tax=Teichococcus globiformis TaxID=2307229 RepID=A0ABV7G373_9PROT